MEEDRGQRSNKVRPLEICKNSHSVSYSLWKNSSPWTKRSSSGCSLLSDSGGARAPSPPRAAGDAEPVCGVGVNV